MNAKRLPSADHTGSSGHASAGNAIGVFAPPGNCTSDIALTHGTTPYPPGVSCFLRLAVSTRAPASFSTGVATRDIGA